MPEQRDEDEPQNDAPSIHSGDSAPDLADIHLAPKKDDEVARDPSGAIFVPMAGPGIVPSSEMETVAEDDLARDAPPTNPFVRIDDAHSEGETERTPPSSTSAVDLDEVKFGGFEGPDAPIAPDASDSAHRNGGAPSPLAPAPRPNAPLNMLLLTWASLATLTALYLWWTRPDHPSNLDTIPDDGALQSMLSTKSKVSPLSALDDRLIVPLKETRRLGHLEVTPLSIEHRKVRVLTADGEVVYEPSVLALTLRVRNAGGNQAFAPSDPAFNTLLGRSTNARVKQTMRVNNKIVFEDGYTYTFAHPVADVESMTKRILPLSVEYAKQERVAEQEFPVLQPGESAEVVILSQEDALPKLDGPMLWRVKLRKGRSAKGTGVATVIGVPFTKDKIAMTVAPPVNRLDG
jgi:hypothetical protein